MSRKLPIIPTIVVVAAMATMIWLGFWQLGRLDQKETMIARFETAMFSGRARAFPGDDGGAFKEEDFFHPTAFECTKVIAREAIAGRNAKDQPGFAHIARCQTGRGPADVKLGWSQNPIFEDWSGGDVVGLITPGGADGARVQLSRPVAGLQPLAQPDPKDLPNNHLAYAVQWFLFAAIAGVIYIIALRKRLMDSDS